MRLLSQARVGAAGIVLVMTTAVAGCGSGGTGTTGAATSSAAVTVGSSPAGAQTVGALSTAPALAPSPADPPPPGGAFDPVLDLLVERLDAADAVAASKWITHQPVTDATREAAVISSASALAEQSGADESYVAAVFGDQIAASKQVQQQLLDEWAAGGGTVPTTAPDLAAQVRPELDRITAQLVPALAAVQGYRDDPQCSKILRDDIAANPGPATAAGRAAFSTAVAHLCDPG